MKRIFDEHAGLQDRLIGTGRVLPELADRLGLTGFAGRASAMAWDLRARAAAPPYDELDVRMATHRNGDVAARVTVRFEEVLDSLDLCSRFSSALPEGEVVTLFSFTRRKAAVAWAGWRAGAAKC